MAGETAIKRISRACLRCRKSKVKCNLDAPDSIGSGRCQRCHRANTECRLVTSRRGGARNRAKSDTPTTPADNSRPILPALDQVLGSTGSTISASTPSATAPYSSSGHIRGQGTDATIIENTFASTSLHDTSDALNLLSRLVSNDTNKSPEAIPRNVPGFSAIHLDSVDVDSLDASQYRLCSNGALTKPQMVMLLERYTQIYHPYYAIAPTSVLDQKNVNETASREPHLFTAMITIATKDLPDGGTLLRATSGYMQELILELFGGQRFSIGAVEALLLLAEWEPYCCLSDASLVGCGDEDNAAWMHIGMAIRLASSLRLDRKYLAIGKGDQNDGNDRVALTWRACYLSDRQISVRLGRAFQIRGEESETSPLGSAPWTLQSGDTTDDSHAPALQARIELTNIFSSVHNILYLGMEGATRSTFPENYASFIQDFNKHISSWKKIWGTLTCSPKLKVLLQLSYEYLRLYTNAFAFQATALRDMTRFLQEERADESINGTPAFYKSTSLPDPSFIEESVDAAKSLLTVVNNYIPQDASLNHFPIRFPLYCVNSAVFLYKIWSLNLLNIHEKISVRRLIFDTIRMLRKDSSRPTDLGSRYARLLELLWQPTSDKVQHEATLGHGNESHSSEALSQAQRFSTLPNRAQEEFSWLDLQSVGDLLTDFPEAEMATDRYWQSSRNAHSVGQDIHWFGVNDTGLLF